MGKKKKGADDELSHSGVIAHRVRNDVVEVLLVTASGSGRWVIPKGHIVEEVGSRESARREAFEEAGVEGDVDVTAFDRYVHGDEEIVVEVFLMRATSEAPSWPEEDVRQRRWASFSEASELVEDSGLRKLLRKAAKSGAIGSKRDVGDKIGKRGIITGVATAILLMAVALAAGKARSPARSGADATVGKSDKKVAAQVKSSDVCRLGDGVTTLPAALTEASGVAASAAHADVLWMHNDSGDPYVYAVDRAGNSKGRVRLTGASVEDWESIDVGPCASGQCLYVADIGDNNASRSEVRIYRVPEPKPDAASSAQVEILRARYPDGAHDAEALFVASNGEIYIVTKGETGPVAIYRYPPSNAGTDVATLERVRLLDDGKIAKKDRVTDADISADGRWIVLRSTRDLTFYPASDFNKPGSEGRTMDVKSLKEPQGEGVSFGATSASLILTGEGGKKKQPGTLAEIQCTLD